MRKTLLAAGAALTLSAAGAAHAQDVGDPEAGANVFKRCMACHKVGPDAKNGIGPALNGIVGEKVGMVEGYTFSPGFTEWAADKGVWNSELLHTWLSDPRAVVKGTKMAFPGLKKPEDLNNVIAYLASFDEQGQKRDPAEALAAAAQ